MPMAEVMTQGLGVTWRSIWGVTNNHIRDFLNTVDTSRWTIVKYEDLVTEPRPVMERVCEMLGLPFHEAVLTPYEGDRMREGPKGARATGDPNLAGRGKIRADFATKWLDGFDADGADGRYRAFTTTRDLNDHLDAVLRPGDLVFLVGNRDIVHLERLIVGRRETVVCWREGCRIPRHCRDCRWFEVAAAA